MQTRTLKASIEAYLESKNLVSLKIWLKTSRILSKRYILASADENSFVTNDFTSAAVNKTNKNAAFSNHIEEQNNIMQSNNINQNSPNKVLHNSKAGRNENNFK